MKLRYLKGALVLLPIVLCGACASRSLAPPRCDLATAVPINASEASSESKTPVAAPAFDVTESATPQGQTAKDEGRKP